VKISEVETLEDFKKYLSELSENCEVAALFYQPIADKLNELYWQVKWNYGTIGFFSYSVLYLELDLGVYSVN